MPIDRSLNHPQTRRQARPLRGAVIGAGYFSHFHLDAWSRIEGVEIALVCDADSAKAQAVAQQYGIAEAAANSADVFARDDIDFVDIVTRPDTHLDLVRDAAQRRLPTICQKPLAPTTGEAVELVQAAQATNTRLMIHENFRFQPWYREIKTLWDSGVIGTRLHTLTFRSRMGDGHGDDAYLARQPYFQTMNRFIIFEAGIHTVDTFRFLGGDIRRVWCHHRKLNPVIAGEDTAIAMFEFNKGGMGMYDASRFNETNVDNPRYTFGVLWMEADGGTIRLDADGSVWVHPLEQSEYQHEYQPSTEGFAGDCVFATQQHFVDRLRDGVDFETSGMDYLKSIHVTEAMYASAESGTWQDCQSE